MKKITSLFLFFTFVFTVSVASVSAQAALTGIDRQVEKSINKLTRYEVFDYIDFDVNGGVVTLTGKVRNSINKSEIEGRVKRIPGVTDVVNKIELLPLGSFDERIRRDLYVAISNSGGLSRYLWPVHPDVRLIVDRGHVTLVGSVYNQGDYNMMNIMARTVPGAFTVTNNLTVGSDR